MYIYIYYEKKVSTVMVNNSNKINKINNNLSLQIIEHNEKDHDRWCWKPNSWLGIGTQMWQISIVERVFRSMHCCEVMILLYLPKKS